VRSRPARKIGRDTWRQPNRHNRVVVEIGFRYLFLSVERMSPAGKKDKLVVSYRFDLQRTRGAQGADLGHPEIHPPRGDQVGNMLPKRLLTSLPTIARLDPAPRSARG
jgi:hypothetical protein